MVLAAGFGRRMQPLTNDRPKPLVEVAGRPLLDWALAVLGDAGVAQVVVNVHYLAEQIEAHLVAIESGPRVRISDERDCLLETGGGITRALPLLDCDPFLAINTDCVWLQGRARAVARLAEAWDDTQMDALLLLVPKAQAHGYAGTGDFSRDELGRLTRQPGETPAPFVYTGLQMLSKRLFAGWRAEPFSMRVLWDAAAAAGRLRGVVHDGYWHDVGTVQAKIQLEEALCG